jgi:hypothetical protein
MALGLRKQTAMVDAAGQALRPVSMSVAWPPVIGFRDRRIGSPARPVPLALVPAAVHPVERARCGHRAG